MSDTNALLSITGSRLRAAILEELFRDGAVPRTVGGLAAVIGADWSGVKREVSDLVAAGILKAEPNDLTRSPLHVADPAWPGHLQLAELVFVRSGIGAAIRDVLTPLHPHQLVWVYGRSAQRRGPYDPLRIAAVTHAAREVRKLLEELGSAHQRRLVVDAMSISEWTTRVAKREMNVLAIRRAHRLWLIGDSGRLYNAEDSEVSAARTLKHAIANWREELSDDWTEDWDPYHPFAR